MNVNIDAEPSKLHVKEVRNSMSGGVAGRYFSTQNTIYKD